MQANTDAIGFSGYKSFSKESFYQINMKPRITVFIGKNNGGKSTCLDVLESVFSPEYFNKNKEKFSRISLSFILNDSNILAGFSRSISGGDVLFYGTHYDYGKEFIGKKYLEI